MAQVLHTVRPERRSEVRVRLRVSLKLRGTDMNDKAFEEVSATENISRSGFLCGCTAVLQVDSTIEVELVSEGAEFVGKARVVRSEGSDTPYPRYAFRFIQKDGSWILQ